MSSINLHIIREITAELSMGSFAARAAMVLVAIALLTLTFAALETYLSGDESLSALEAAMNFQPKLSQVGRDAAEAIRTPVWASAERFNRAYGHL